MGCCAIGTCDDPNCYLCTVVAKLPQPATYQERQAKYAESTKKPSYMEDHDPSKKKRKRVGPHR